MGSRLAWLCAGLSLAVCASAGGQGQHPNQDLRSNQDLHVAQDFARLGKLDAAVAAAERVPAGNPQFGAAQELLCALQGSIDAVDAAVSACEAAHKAEPNNADYTLQLARAYGAKADHSSAFTGLRMVGRIRDTFEAAVQQAPRSVEALSDLGEFYVEAPAIVGGGETKARALVSRLQPLSPARAARLEGMIDAKDKNYAAADAAYARELSFGHSAEAYVDLANYDRKRGMIDQAAANAVSAIRVDATSGADSIDAAQLLIDLNRNLDVAAKALRGYLSHQHASAVAADARAHVMLGKILSQQGDRAGAQAQFQQALELASGYGAARRASHS